MRTCHDCFVSEGQIHNYGCDMERCPFCGHQLIFCHCCYEKLNLIDRQKYDITTGYLSPDIYSKGLSENLEATWIKTLNSQGRIPYIEYPVVCIKCGKLYPDFFHVSDDEWDKYIQPDMREGVVCTECYQLIKNLIDGNI